MVDVLGAFGNLIDVNPFYVSFVITPLASNAAEVIVGLRNASKKTNKAMTDCCGNLYGAAVMNCTFCLAIFLGLVYFRGLQWNYTAEVSGILMVIWCVGFLGQKHTQNMVDAVVTALLFPASVALIWFMENVLQVA
jgi:Ca2+/Na+ antiporter